MSNFTTLPLMPQGMGIITDRNMTETVEDWSGVRSPGRARRRRTQGHPQRIKIRLIPSKQIYQLGDSLVMHPETLRQLEVQMDAEMKRRSLISGILYGKATP